MNSDRFFGLPSQFQNVFFFSFKCSPTGNYVSAAQNLVTLPSKLAEFTLKIHLASRAALFVAVGCADKVVENCWFAFPVNRDLTPPDISTDSLFPYRCHKVLSSQFWAVKVHTATIYLFPLEKV